MNVRNLSVDSVLEKINFKVEREPVYLKGGREIPERFAVVRQDSKAVLGFVSDRYKLIENKEVFQKPLETIVGNFGFNIKRFCLKNDGAQTAIDLWSPEQIVVKGLSKDEIYLKRIIFVNSYDKSSSMKLLFGAFRLICTNGAGIWSEKSGSFRTMHMGENADQKKLIADIQNVLVNYKVALEEYFEQLRFLNAKKIGESRIKDLFEKLDVGDRTAEHLCEIMKRNAKKELTFLDAYHAYTQFYRDKEEKKEDGFMNNVYRTQNFGEKFIEYAKTA